MGKHILKWSLPLIAAASLAAAEGDGLERDAKIAVLNGLTKSCVQVEYTLQYDQGEAPTGAGVSYRCPHCGGIHYSSSFDDYVDEERPYEIPGYLIDATTVVTNDVLINPRFIKSLDVRFGDTVVSAEPKAYSLTQHAVMLKLAQPLTGAEPLTFVKSKEKPAYLATYQQSNAEWAASIQSFTSALSNSTRLGPYLVAESKGVLLDTQGATLTLLMNERLAADDSWLRPPTEWTWLPADEYAGLGQATDTLGAQSILRVTLNFRSPKKGDNGGYSSYRYYYNDDDNESATEVRTLGVVIDNNQILVLKELTPKVTTRLEKITAHLADGSTVAAKFAYSLKDYGALVATLEKPLTPVKLSSLDTRDLYDQLLPSLDVRLYGETRKAYPEHRRVLSHELGRRHQAFPEVAGPTEPFVYDRDGGLLALPVTQRQKVTEESRWRSAEPVLTPITHLLPVFADLTANSDTNNVPLTEEEENRLAWIGVEMQSLDADLARANNVSEQTRNGSVGGMVSYVYDGSPAQRVGVQMGDILLRLHIEGEPKPLDVSVDGYAMWGGSFPWDQLDSVSEEYYDQIPQPWPSVETQLTRALTTVGFGKSFEAEVLRNGETLRLSFVIEEGPPHFDSAKRYKNKTLDLTVRNLTYEARRYFQKTKDDPGVIISKIESGGKAAVSGLKPYEIITHVNDEPVTSVDDFERLIALQKELRLSVTRMTRGRVVKIDLTDVKDDESDEEHAEDETTGDETAEDDGEAVISAVTEEE